MLLNISVCVGTVCVLVCSLCMCMFPSLLCLQGSGSSGRQPACCIHWLARRFIRAIGLMSNSFSERSIKLQDNQRGQTTSCFSSFFSFFFLSAHHSEGIYYDEKHKGHFGHYQWINCEFLTSVQRKRARARFVSAAKRQTLPHKAAARAQLTTRPAFQGGVFWESEPKAQSLEGLENRNHCF